MRHTVNEPDHDVHSEQQNKLSHIGPQIAATVSLLIGGFWLTAWAGGFAQRWIAGPSVIMKTNMALAQVLSSVAVLCVSWPGSRSWRIIGGLLGSIVFLIGAITALEYLFNVNLGIDQLLCVEPLGALGAISPNRMGPPGALSLTLLGLGIVCVAIRKRSPAPYLGLLVVAINLIPAMGYLYGATAFYQNARYTVIAWPTIPALMCLGMSLILACPDLGPMPMILRQDAGGELLRKLLPGTILIPIVLGQLRTIGEAAGLYGPLTGRALLVLSVILVFSILLWISASRLSGSAVAASEAQEQLEYANSIIESSDEAIIGKTLDGVITSWNRGAEQLYGYSAREMIGRPMDVLMPPDRKNELRNILARLSAGERIESYEAIRQCKDGRLIEVSVKISPIIRSGTIIGASSIAHDITAEKKSQQALKESKELLETLIKSAPVGLAMFDRKMRYVQVSDQWLRDHGLQQENLIGKSHHEIVPDLPEHLRVAHQRGFAGESVLGEQEWGYGDRKRLVRWAVHPWGDSGETTGGIILFSEDITERKRSQEMLIRSEKLASVGRMAATVAHEINNPLAAAMNAVFLASSYQGLPPDVQQVLALAEQELARASHITRQTLGFYKESTEPKLIDVAQIVDEVLTLYSQKLSNKSIRVKRELQCAKAYAVEGEVRQIISNLITNGIDALSMNGTLRLKVASQGSLNGAGRMVRFTIADDGAGIRREHMSRIFEPFFTTKEAFGTGLGLWVTKELVNKQRGAIRVRSNPGKGTAFSVWLPIERRREERKTA